MPVRFSDKHETFNYDPIGPGAVHMYVQDLSTDLQNYKVLVDERMRQVYSHMNEVKDSTDDLHKEIIDSHKQLIERIMSIDANIEAMKLISLEQFVVISTFLNSRFVRFLNFFGCWFIYPPKNSMFSGRIYKNTPENESFGKAPLLTRLKRWFIKHIPKRKDDAE